MGLHDAHGGPILPRVIQNPYGPGLRLRATSFAGAAAG
ncbi:hypothetical protein FHY19_002212 [Xanthomonas arboricola]|nr:hypothetical protein [Xanthomonas sp. 3793]MCS3809187.1 hypothetical protein [Xanthomonas sp. 4461]